MHDAGMQVLPLIARPGEPLEPIFENLTGKGTDALLIQGSIARCLAAPMPRRGRQQRYYRAYGV